MRRGGYENHWDDPSGIPVLTADEAYRRRRKKRQARHAADNGWSLPPFDEAFSTENLLSTADDLARDGGPAPGVDGLTLRAVSRRELASLLREVSKDVLAGTYRPQPTRRVPVQKRSGGSRLLKIPSVLDRVVARRQYELLTPIVERLFLQNSFGFRPGRNTWHALAALEAAMHLHGAWVLTPDDIKAAFDNVLVDAALEAIARHIKDRQFMCLTEALLRGSRGNNRKGISQGHPFSPVVLNVLLHHAHDVLIDAEGTLASWLRYADDLAYLTREVSEGRGARERAAELLKQVGLTLKGPGEPIDLREGGTVKLLGLELRLHDGDIRYEIPADAYMKLETNLEEAHVAEDPPETARRAIHGWINSYSPTFEYSADDAIVRVLGLTARYGFRKLLTDEDIRKRWRSAHQFWTALRERSFREAGL
jgi:retron-type reverse transcriptase